MHDKTDQPVAIQLLLTSIKITIGIMDMDNGNDPPACIPCLEISDKNMISRNSGFICMEFPV